MVGIITPLVVSCSNTAPTPSPYKNMLTRQEVILNFKGLGTRDWRDEYGYPKQELSANDLSGYDAIGDEAFDDLTNELKNQNGSYFRLKSVMIPPSIISIEPYAFRYLDSFGFQPGSNLKYIYRGAFWNTKSNGTLTIPKNVEFIDISAFSWSNFSKVEFESNSKLKDLSGFSKMSNLTEFTIPKSVEIINYKAFERTKSLINITLEPNSSLKIINSSAFGEVSISTLDLTPAKNLNLIDPAFYYISQNSNETLLKTIDINWTPGLEEQSKNWFKSLIEKPTINWINKPA